METPAHHKYDLLTEKRDGYLYVLVRTAAFGPEVYRWVFQDIRSAVLDERSGRLMFEFEAADALTEHETYEFVTELLRMMRGMCIALVARDARHRPSLAFVQAFGLAVGRQFGSFTNTADAEKWLLQD